MNTLIISPIIVNEIKQAFDEMDLNKAPRLDGFTAQFIKTCWNIVKRISTK